MRCNLRVTISLCLQHIQFTLFKLAPNVDLFNLVTNKTSLNSCPTFLNKVQTSQNTIITIFSSKGSEGYCY